MKKFLFLFMTFVLGMSLMGGTALAYTIDDTTMVVRKTSNGGPWASEWKDVVGNPAVFDIFGIDISIVNDTVTLEMYSNFNNDGVYQIGAATVYVADIALDLDQNGSFETAIVLKDHSTWTPGIAPTLTSLAPGLYAVDTSQTNDTANAWIVSGWDTSWHFMEPLTDPIKYAGRYGQPSDPNVVTGPVVKPPVAVAALDTTKGTAGKLGDLVTVTMGQSTGGTDPNYKWTVSFLLSDLGLDGFDAIDLLWGGTTCANDTITGTLNPVPEPATMLLLGAGLIGLAGFGRKRLFKK